MRYFPTRNRGIFAIGVGILIGLVANVIGWKMHWGSYSEIFVQTCLVLEPPPIMATIISLTFFFWPWKSQNARTIYKLISIAFLVSFLCFYIASDPFSGIIKDACLSGDDVGFPPSPRPCWIGSGEFCIRYW